MAILKVARMGHPVLRQIAEPVTEEEVVSPEFQQFFDDMLETMDEYDGAGLAAPQVHVSKQIALLELSSERGPEFFINPVITPIGDATGLTWEGCLSVPEMRGLVERSSHIRIEAVGRDGEAKAFELKGFPAVVVQHECDHLQGILYVDRAEPRTLAFLEEHRRYGGFRDDDSEEYWDDDEPPEDADEGVQEAM